MASACALPAGAAPIARWGWAAFTTARAMACAMAIGVHAHAPRGTRVVRARFPTASTAGGTADASFPTCAAAMRATAAPRAASHAACTTARVQAVVGRVWAPTDADVLRAGRAPIAPKPSATSLAALTASASAPTDARAMRAGRARVATCPSARLAAAAAARALRPACANAELRGAALTAAASAVRLVASASSRGTRPPARSAPSARRRWPRRHTLLAYLRSLATMGCPSRASATRAGAAPTAVNRSAPTAATRSTADASRLLTARAPRAGRESIAR